MTKSFKQLLSPGHCAQVKPLSELDFFALREKPEATAEPASFPEPAQERPATDNGNIDNPVISLNTVIAGNPVNNKNTSNRTPKKRPPTASNTGNTNKTHNGNKGGDLDNLVNCPVPGDSNSVVMPVVEAGSIRQTFVLSRKHLEQLRDFVHARRAQGEYNYSQKQAVQEGLDLLFATSEPAGPRPDQAREREEQHRERIQQGRQIRATNR